MNNNSTVNGQTINIPYTIGDYVEWFCFDDYKIHKSKILSVEIEIVRGREPLVVYCVRLKFKGDFQEAKFTMASIEAAKKFRKSRKYLK